MRNLKLFAVSTLLMISTISFAEESVLQKVKDNKEIIETVYSDSKELTESVYKDGKIVTGTLYNDSKDLLHLLYEDGKIVSSKLESALLSIAEGLKTTSLKAWDILVKQQLVWSWCYLLLTLSSMFLWYKFGVQFIKMQNDKDENGQIKDTNVVYAVLICILALIDSGISGFHFEQMMTGFINPEFGAIRTLFELAKSL